MRVTEWLDDAIEIYGWILSMIFLCIVGCLVAILCPLWMPVYFTRRWLRKRASHAAGAWRVSRWTREPPKLLCGQRAYYWCRRPGCGSFVVEVTHWESSCEHTYLICGTELGLEFNMFGPDSALTDFEWWTDKIQSPQEDATE